MISDILGLYHFDWYLVLQFFVITDFFWGNKVWEPRSMSWILNQVFGPVSPGRFVSPRLHMHRPYIRNSELAGPWGARYCKKNLPRWFCYLVPLWLMLTPSHILWVCLLRTLILHIGLFLCQSALPPLSSMWGQEISLASTHLPPYLQFTTKSCVIWLSSPFLSIHSHCHWPPSGFHHCF